MLENVKKALGITGTYQDDTLTEYINEVKSFLLAAGVAGVLQGSYPRDNAGHRVPWCI